MSDIRQLFKEGEGILRLAPTWVPRAFCRPAKRIKLHPDDYYVLGLKRGGIDERWFSSTTPADNGPGTPKDEGLSYIVSAGGKTRALLIDAVAELKGDLIGESLSGASISAGLCIPNSLTTWGRCRIISTMTMRMPRG